MASNNIGGSITVQQDKRDDGVVRKELRERLRNAQEGLVNWVGEFTLADDGATTSITVRDDKVTPNSEISFQPMTVEAAALMVKLFVATLTAGNPWSGVNEGRFIVTHPAIVAGYTCKFRYSIKG